MNIDEFRSMPVKDKLTSFVAYVEAQDPAREINHEGLGWDDCAVGDWLCELTGIRSSFEAGISEPWFLGDSIRQILGHHDTANDYPTYGHLAKLMQT